MCELKFIIKMPFDDMPAEPFDKAGDTSYRGKPMKEIRHKKRKIRIRKKFVVLCASLLILVLLIININLIIENYNLEKETSNNQVGYIVSAANEDQKLEITVSPAPETTEKPVQRDEWYMLLVNRWNPLPDDYPITLHDLGNGESVDERIYPYLQQMFDAAIEEGYNPVVVSGYRTSEYQENLFQNELSKYMNYGMGYDEAYEAARQWVALVGTSEHQAGLAVDINAARGNGLNYSERNQQIWAWLKEHCAEYGFILRYPEGKTEITGIQYEPWHFRYVGVEAAQYIMENEITFEEFLR